MTAVAGIDLDIGRGEFFSLLGPSGSGKTTTLRMIAGFELPSARARPARRQGCSRLPPYERDVNTVFQDYALFPHMTVGDNVAYGLMIRKVSRDERRRRAAEALRMVRLEGYEERKPGQLSGGQRQRVALARALVNRPSVLLLDEPLGALDLKLRQEMQIELKTIQQEVGITFIYVTHDQDEALAMSDRMAIFDRGLIEQVGSPAEVYESPATAFVAGFVGTSNILFGASGWPGPSRCVPRRSTCECRRHGARRLDIGRRDHPWRRLPGIRHSISRGARRGRPARGHQAERGHVLHGGAGPEGHVRAARRRLEWRPAHVRGRNRRRRRQCVRTAGTALVVGLLALDALAAVLESATSSTGPRKARWPSSASRRARSTWWRGEAMSRTAPMTRPSTG